MRTPQNPHLKGKNPDLKVIYRGLIDLKADKAIIKALKGIGYKWYAQGMNYETRERDIVFDKEGNQ